MVYALMCLSEALTAVLPPSLKLEIFLIKLWTFYLFTLMTHTLTNNKINVNGLKKWNSNKLK